MKKFTTFYKMSLCALAVIALYGCGTYNASPTSYVNGIYGRSERMSRTAAQASSPGRDSSREQKTYASLPDSLARYLEDSTYVPAPDSYEMKLRQFDKEKYEKPVNVTVVNNYLNYNPWWYSYSFNWWDPFWDPWWDPYWDPWWPRPYLSIHVGPYWHGPYWYGSWWPGSWYHPYYPYNPWRPAIIVPVYAREARYSSRTSTAWGGGGSVSGASRYGRAAAGSTYVRGNSGTARRAGSSYTRNSYSNTKSYSASIRNGRNQDKERLYDYSHGNGGSTTSYRRTGRVGQSGGGSYTKGSSSPSGNYNSNNGNKNNNSGSYQRSGNYNNSSNYNYNNGNNGSSGGYQYRRTGGNSSMSGGGGYSPSRSSGGGFSSPSRSSGGSTGGGRRR